MSLTPRHLRLIALIIGCLILMGACLIWANLVFMHSRLPDVPAAVGVELVFYARFLIS